MESNWWETPRQLIEVHTHGWSMDDATGRNTKLKGWILSADTRGIHLMQQSSGVNEETGEGRYKMRRIFIPWATVVYIAEPEWKERDEQLVVVHTPKSAAVNGVDA